MEYLLTGAEMSDCDRRTSEEIGIPSLVLMERAALSVADGADSFLRQCGGRQPRVLAVAGRGNNGADALATGRILLERGYKVSFCRLSGEISPGSSFAVQEKILKSYGGEIVPFPDFTWSGPDPDLIIDGLFGTGLSRDLTGEAAECVDMINSLRDRSGSYVIAVDIPSGISSDDGRVMGCAVRCDETRTFAFYKRGHFMYPGANFAGELHLAQIGITRRAFRAEPEMFTFLKETAGDLLPARNPGGNKGTFGKVVLVAGRHNMCGAALLAGRACLAAGAGMVKIFTHESNRVIIQEELPEALLDTYSDLDTPEQAAEKLRASLAWADIAAAGPGMGTDVTGRALLGAVLDAVQAQTSGPQLRGLVLDADALRLLAEDPQARAKLAGRKAGLPCILTPHMGEFAALAGRSIRDCIEKRPDLVREAAQELGCTIACKDARTLVMTGKTPGRMYLNISGNSGMAGAGSGDVLTGMTAAFLGLMSSARSGAGQPDVFSKTDIFSAQDLVNGFAAACCAVYLHGRAGDLARAAHGEQGMTAGDLIEALRRRDFWSGTGLQSGDPAGKN